MLATNKGKLLSRFTFAYEEPNVSIAYIEKTMTLDKALKLLQQKSVSPDRMKVVEQLAHNDTHQFLQKQGPGDVTGKAYGGAETARQMLNDMLEQLNTRFEYDYDTCEQYFKDKCAAMSNCRGDRAMYNNMAATARKCILKHQATINQMQEEIPKLKNELAVHEMDCAHKLYDLKWDISTVKRDVAVMTEVLKLAECKESKCCQTTDTDT